MSEISQSRAGLQFEWSAGNTEGREKPSSSRQVKDTRRVVLGMTKSYSATEVARLRRLQYSSFGRATVFEQSAAGSIPAIDKKAKSASRENESGLILDG